MKACNGGWEQNNKRIAKECAIMVMDPRKMDDRARQYWELLTHGDILVKMCGGGGKGVVHGDSDGSA